jgi:hypothetical protein
MMENGCSYRELFRLIEQLPGTRHGDRSLPPEVIHIIANFIPLKMVVPAEAIPIRACSIPGIMHHNGRWCYSDSNDCCGTCWLGSLLVRPLQDSTIPLGVEDDDDDEGKLFVEFQLSANGPCQLTSMSISSPTRSYFPCLTVPRTLRLDGQFGDTWRSLCPIWTVEATADWQHSYTFERPVEAQVVRLVVLSTSRITLRAAFQWMDWAHREPDGLGCFYFKFE